MGIVGKLFSIMSSTRCVDPLAKQLGWHKKDPLGRRTKTFRRSRISIAFCVPEDEQPCRSVSGGHTQGPVFVDREVLISVHG